MQKFTSSGGHSDTLPRDLQPQLGESKENMAPKQLLSQQPEQIPLCIKKRVLVGLDVICLCVAYIPFFACELKAVAPYRHGFFYGDTSITYTYVERAAIPDGLLMAGGIAITAVQ